MAVERQSILSSRLLSSALAYAERGFHVFPVRLHRKAPLIKAWPSRATTDRAAIRQWWSRHPDANIGIATGPSGLVAIDVDVKDGALGMESWGDILQEHGQALGDPAKWGVWAQGTVGVHYGTQRFHLPTIEE